MTEAHRLVGTARQQTKGEQIHLGQRLGQKPVRLGVIYKVVQVEEIRVVIEEAIVADEEVDQHDDCTDQQAGE